MTRLRRAEAAVAAVGIVIGICGLVVARNLEFTAATGGVLFERSDDMIWGKLFQFSPLGAIVTIALGALALLGSWAGRRALVFMAAGGFALCAVQVIAQFGREDNVFGVRGGNLSLFLALAVGLLVLALADVGNSAAVEGSTA